MDPQGTYAHARGILGTLQIDQENGVREGAMFIRDRRPGELTSKTILEQHRTFAIERVVAFQRVAKTGLC